LPDRLRLPSALLTLLVLACVSATTARPEPLARIAPTAVTFGQQPTGLSPLFDPDREASRSLDLRDQSPELRSQTRSGGRSTHTEEGTWQKLLPSPVEHHVAVLDPVRNQMIVFGGMYSYGFYGDDAVWCLPLSGPPLWRRMSIPGSTPSPRYHHSAIYDPIRDRLLVFGGFGPSSLLNDVWALNLSGTPNWIQLSPSGGAPSPRAAHSAVYDPVHDRMVIFGGLGTGNLVHGDVWALSLGASSAWTALSPGGTPPVARSGHSAIYDPVIKRMIVYGGYRGGNAPDYENDVWILSLDGPANWASLATSGALAPRSTMHTAMYDPSRHRMVVIGAANLLTQFMSLSLSEPATWTIEPNATVPGLGAQRQAAVFDAARDRVVAFGGSRDDLCWELRFGGVPDWNAVTIWPAPRANHTFVHDSVHGRMLLYGGIGVGGQRFGDVWSLSPVGLPDWTLLEPEGTPPEPRLAHVAIGDPVHDRMIVHGGVGQSGATLGDLWELSLTDGAHWSQLSPSGGPPPPRSGHAAVYVPTLESLVMFGGQNSTGMLDDVWMLSLGASPHWTQLTPSAPAGWLPPPRRDHTLTYDPVRNRLVMTGGSNSTHQPMEDVWILNLQDPPAWLPVTYMPTRRADHTAVYDPLRDRLVVVGGVTLPTDPNLVQILDFRTEGLPFWSWYPATPLDLPPLSRGAHSAVLDPIRDRLLIFGAGYVDGAGGIFLNELWGLAWADDELGVEPPMLGGHETLSLGLVHPNPARGAPTFEVKLAVSSNISLAIFDIAGRWVQSVVDASLTAGVHTLTWDRTDELGRSVPPGLYHARLTGNGAAVTRKFLLLD